MKLTIEFVDIYEHDRKLAIAGALLGVSPRYWIFNICNGGDIIYTIEDSKFKRGIKHASKVIEKYKHNLKQDENLHPLGNAVNGNVVWE